MNRSAKLPAVCFFEKIFGGWEKTALLKPMNDGGIQHERMKIRFAGKAVLRICRSLCQKNFVFC